MAVENLQNPIPPNPNFTPEERSNLQSYTRYRRHFVIISMLVLFLLITLILISVFVANVIGMVIGTGLTLIVIIIAIVVASIKIHLILKGRPMPSFDIPTSTRQRLRKCDYCYRLGEWLRKPTLPWKKSNPSSTFHRNDFSDNELPKTLDETLACVNQCLNNEWTKGKSNIMQGEYVRGIRGQRNHEILGITVYLFSCPFSPQHIEINHKRSLLENLLNASGPDIPRTDQTSHSQTTLIFIPESDLEPTSSGDNIRIRMAEAAEESGSILTFFELTVISEYSISRSIAYPNPGVVTSSNLEVRNLADDYFRTFNPIVRLEPGFSQFITGRVPSSDQNPNFSLTMVYNAFYQLYRNALNAVQPNQTNIVLVLPGYNYNMLAVDGEELNEQSRANRHASTPTFIGDEACLAAALHAIKDACLTSLPLRQCRFQLLFNVCDTSLI